MRRRVLSGRRHGPLPWIGGRGEHPFIQFAIALRRLLLLVLQQLLDLLGVAPHRLGEARELVREDLGIGEPEHRGADRLREGTSVHERGVVEPRVPGEVIVNRVIDAPTVLAAVAQIQRSDADVLEERRKVRSRAERVDPEIGLGANLAATLGRGRVGDGAQLSALPDTELRLRVFNVSGHVVDEAL